MQFEINRTNSRPKSDNDRLQRAIERNRAKQAKKAGLPGSVTLPQSAPTVLGSEQRSIPRPATRPTAVRPTPVRSAPVRPTPGRPAATTASWGGGAAPSSTPIQSRLGGSSRPIRPTANGTIPQRPTRVSVARGDEVNFVNPIRSSFNQAPASVSYTTGSSASISSGKRWKFGWMERLFGSTKYIDYLAYAGWIFCFIVMCRLVFAERGVVDYYSRKKTLVNKTHQLRLIQQENDDIHKEIEMINTDRNYQKKLVRDNLGFISKDEYLILFPKENGRR